MLAGVVVYKRASQRKAAEAANKMKSFFVRTCA